MSDDLAKIISETIGSQLKKMGTFNLLIAGKSGVGKSTLVNAIFEGELAKTGVGRPVSLQSTEITKEGLPLRLIDTRGLELTEYQQIIKDLIVYIKIRNSSSSASEHVHAAWICIAEGTPRVETAEAELVRALYELNVRSVVVITQAFRKDGEKFKSEIARAIPEAANVVRVVAADIEVEEGRSIPKRGLDDLLEITIQLIPEATEKAFAAVATLLDIKEKTAKKTVNLAATIAAGFAATPLPIVNLALLVPTAVGMLWDVGRIFGYQADKKFTLWLMKTAVGVAASDGVVKVTFALLAQFFPGISQLANATVSATVVFGAVQALGYAYAAALKRLSAEGRLSAELENDELKSELKAEIRDQIDSARNALTVLNLNQRSATSSSTGS